MVEISENREYSYHIFSFPFKINSLNGKDEFDGKTKLEDIGKIIDERYWKKTPKKSLKSKTNEDIDKNLNYNIKTYFYSSVQDAIYNNNNNEIENDQIVTNYNYDLSGENYYIIDVLEDNRAKTNKEAKEKLTTFKLTIDKIELKIYETGVGILSFFLKNSRHAAASDILKINSMGRRIYPPFFNLADNSENVLYSIRAKELPFKIQLDISNEESLIEEFKYEEFNKDIKIGNHILGILKFDKKRISIQPIIDDRMFVISYILRDRLIDVCKSKKDSISENLYNELEAKKYKDSDYWYKYLYIDSEKLTVQNEDMKKEFIEKSTYKRWTNCQTLFGISRYSFVLSKNVKLEFINVHVKTLYYEMVCLILAQRASILNFSDEVSKISSFNNEDSERINDLYKNYIEFTNRLYFREVTAQEQGIELYNMLLDINNVNNEISKLKEEMATLYNYAKYLKSQKSEKSLKWIENLNKWFLIPTFLTGLLGINIFQNRFSLVEKTPNFSVLSVLADPFYIALIIVIFFMFIPSFIMFIPSVLLYFKKIFLRQKNKIFRRE